MLIKTNGLYAVPTLANLNFGSPKIDVKMMAKDTELKPAYVEETTTVTQVGDKDPDVDYLPVVAMGAVVVALILLSGQ